jgi:uncharacterized membrane protein YhhN
VIGDSLRKSFLFLILGVVSYVIVLMAMRASAGENFFQPQSDFGILIGAAIVALIVIARNIIATNRKQDL